MHLVIDYFTATFPFICYEDEMELKIIDELIMLITEFLSFKKEDAIKEAYSQNRFLHQYLIGEFIIVRFIGPELKSGYRSCSIELKGQACREFESMNEKKDWIDFLDFFVIRLNANPTRIDIAVDDFEGNDVNLQWIKNKLDLKQYTTSFKKKYYKLHGCEEEGWSLQFGSHNSSQMLVIYEKLKEQLSKGIECNQKYWLRYEMRYMKDKAYNVCLSLIKQGKTNMQNYIYSLLYQMLDIKIKSNYSENELYKTDTDPKWLAFLNNVEKGTIEKYKIKSTSYLSYIKWASPRAALYFIMTYFDCDSNFEQTVTRLAENGLEGFNKIDKRILKNINQFRREKGFSKLTEDNIESHKKKIENIIFERKLPF